MADRYDDLSPDEPPSYAPGEHERSRPEMPILPARPVAERSRPSRSSLLPVAALLLAIGLLLSLLIVCSGGNIAVLVLVAGLGGFVAMHYLVWGWWLGGVIDRRARRGQVILVDENDREIGHEAKTRAHEHGGKLHRALSVFIFNSSGQMLLQHRSTKKYHFGGLWTNACCSHPHPGETVIEAAHRCLRHELGFDIELREVCTFLYRAEDPTSGLCEHELDHVLIGVFDGDPKPNPKEVDALKWIEVDELQSDLARSPARYSPWFPIAFEALESAQTA